MRLTEEDVENMSYENFTTLRHILSSTLGDLSKMTETQKKEIQEQQDVYYKLVREQEKLKKIYDENKKKSDEIKGKIDKL